ncbi:unnamed protein product, partial [Ascophyllum nodosum]
IHPLIYFGQCSQFLAFYMTFTYVLWLLLPLAVGVLFWVYPAQQQRGFQRQGSEDNDAGTSRSSGCLLVPPTRRGTGF